MIRKAIDVESLKQHARNRWMGIFAEIGIIPATSLDGKHHPCPKCGGTDRFRCIDMDSGAVFCNKCFNSNNGDGIAAVMWSLGIPFMEATEKISAYLGLEQRKPQKRGRKSIFQPDGEFRDEIAQVYCDKYGFSLAAIKSAGGMTGKHFDGQDVIGFSVIDPEYDTVGYLLVAAHGGMVNVKNGQVTKKLTPNCKAGLIGTIEKLNDEPEVAWKVEGLTDVLAVLTAEPDAVVVTNSSGAGQRTGGMPTMFYRPTVVNVVGDADDVGIAGATVWAQSLFTTRGEKETRNVRLPFDSNSKKDVRDFLSEFSFVGLEVLARKPEFLVEKGQIAVKYSYPNPYNLAMNHIERYRKMRDGANFVFWRGSWFKFNGKYYKPIGKSDLESFLAETARLQFDIEYLESQKKSDEEGRREFARDVTASIVSNARLALQSICKIPESIEPFYHIEEKCRKNWIVMENGILDVDAVISGQGKVLLPHTDKFFSQVMLDYEYDPSATCPHWDTVLMELLEDNLELRHTLKQWFGYSLTASNDHQRFIMLEGDGSTGKSTVIAGLLAMIGASNCSFVPLEILHSRFSLQPMVGKLLNICADCGGLNSEAEGILKSMVSGDPVMVDRKNLPAISVSPTARIVVATNAVPRIKDKTDAMWRRMIPIPFRKIIAPENRIRGMDKGSYWRSEAPGILNWAIQGLIDLEKNSFLVAVESAALLKESVLESNPARAFLEENYECQPEGECGSFSYQVYEAYVKYCLENGYKSMGSRMFGREIARTFPDSERSTKRESGGDTKKYWKFVFPKTAIF